MRVYIGVGDGGERVWEVEYGYTFYIYIFNFDMCSYILV